MSTRATAIACVTFVALTVSAANVTTAFDVTVDARSPLLALPGVESLVDVERPAEIPVDTTGTHFELLSAIYGHSETLSSEPGAFAPHLDAATMWLARAIYSETKLPHEQELVAWVIRNRVETGYRGKTTYKGVVLDPYQFSAFNPNAPKRSYYARLDVSTQVPSWHQALSIAHYVRHADPAYRPFSINTRHFFSEVSMPDQRFPYWVEKQHFVSPGWNYTIDARRFRFYEKIS